MSKEVNLNVHDHDHVLYQLPAKSLNLKLDDEVEGVAVGVGRRYKGNNITRKTPWPAAVAARHAPSATNSSGSAKLRQRSKRISRLSRGRLLGRSTAKAVLINA